LGISSVTNAKTPGSGSTGQAHFRIVGTWDEEGTLIFSQGYKNFQSKDSCHYCHLKKPMMHRYALAKKGEELAFSEEVYCGMVCFRDQQNRSGRGLQGGTSGV
jgi:hypothetical protein